MKEEWRIIKEFNNYSVSNYGRIKNSTNDIIKSRYDKYGYLRVNLSALKGDKYVTVSRFVHRLVAQAFIPNPENCKKVSILNGNKDDIRIENLKWCDVVSSKQRNSKNRGKRIIDNFGNIYLNISQASKINNISTGSIYNCCCGYTKTAGGIVWNYLEEVE